VTTRLKRRNHSPVSLPDPSRDERKRGADRSEGFEPWTTQPAQGARRDRRERLELSSGEAARRATEQEPLAPLRIRPDPSDTQRARKGSFSLVSERVAVDSSFLGRFSRVAETRIPTDGGQRRPWVPVIDSVSRVKNDRGWPGQHSIVTTLSGSEVQTSDLGLTVALCYPLFGLNSSSERIRSGSSRTGVTNPNT
jgi:hypothetical protein